MSRFLCADKRVIFIVWLIVACDRLYVSLTNKEVCVDFSAAYRKCKRSQALVRGLPAVEAILKSYEATEWFNVEEAAIHSFESIHGYKVVTLEGAAFFPKDISKIPVNSGVSWVREAFYSADLVVPPFFSIANLSKAAKEIHEAPSDDEKKKLGGDIIFEMYSLDRISRIVVGVWYQRKSFYPYFDQIIEAIKAYSIGLHGVAIIGLLPCIEGVVRDLGVGIGLNVSGAVDARSLLRVFKKLKSKELNILLDGYSWFPVQELDVKYLDRFHERVQVFTNIEHYFELQLYMHTENLPPSATLNRHGIVHGLFKGYASGENFLRLFNLLNALSLAAIIAEGKGSLMFPPSSPKSEELRVKLVAYRLAGYKLR